MKLVEKITTNNPCYKSGRTRVRTLGLMAHSVGCPQPRAQVFIDSWNNSNAETAVHAVIDGNDGTVYQLLPWNQRAWHCGSGPNGSGNDGYIGVEMCEPSTIRYTTGANFVDNNPTETKKIVKRTYDSLVELFAYLCKMYGLNPLADGVIISHSEGYKRGIASGHADVEHLWSKYGYTMSQFRKDISTAISGNVKTESTSTKKTVKEVALEVIAGRWGNNPERKQRLEAAGYNYEKVQAKVEKLKAKNKTAATPKKSNETIAKEVIAGKWGSGNDRINALTKAGYNPSDIQKIVNSLMKK